jgi:hypothetical protein
VCSSASGDGEVGHDRCRRLQEAGEQLDRVAALLGGGAQHAGEDLPGVSAGPGTVAAPGLAGDHGGADGLLGAPVGGLHAGHPQEGEQVLALGGQVVEESAVGRVAGGPGHQLVDLRAEAVGLGDQPGLIRGSGVVGVAEGERVLEDAGAPRAGCGLARGRCRPAAPGSGAAGAPDSSGGPLGRSGGRAPSRRVPAPRRSRHRGPGWRPGRRAHRRCGRR